MKLISINAVPYGSTASIMVGVSETAEDFGFEYETVTGYSTHPASFVPEKNIVISGVFSKSLHILLSAVTGYDGIFCVGNTRRLIRYLKKINPDIVHLHNLHGHYLCLPMLFGYLRKQKAKVIWTLHDCWSFTGHCPHFDMIGCDKWKTGCHDCPQYRQYPHSLFDNSRKMYALKKKWFTGVKNLTIVTPSRWLAGLVKQSFLAEYPVQVIHNGIDLEVFKPTPSDFREKYHCQDKYLLLGVSFAWNKNKGLDVFIELAHRLPSQYQIVLVGTDEQTDKQLPDNIISIHRTQNQTELAQIYTAADLFVNPTREEVLGLVNLESLACGTPVITFQSGGSPECVDENCGCVVEKDDLNSLIEKIRMIRNNKLYTQENCMERAAGFDRNKKYLEYVKLYQTH